MPKQMSPEQKIIRLERENVGSGGKIISTTRINAVIRVYDEAGKVIETHEHKGQFREP